MKKLFIILGFCAAVAAHGADVKISALTATNSTISSSAVFPVVDGGGTWGLTLPNLGYALSPYTRSNTFSSQFTLLSGTNLNLSTSVPLTNATYVGLYGNTNLLAVASTLTNWLVDLSSNQFITIPQISANVNLILTNITSGANVTLRVIGSASQQYTISLPSGALLLSNTSTNQLNTNKVGIVTFTSFGNVASNVFVGWSATP